MTECSPEQRNGGPGIPEEDEPNLAHLRDPADNDTHAIKAAQHLLDVSRPSIWTPSTPRNRVSHPPVLGQHVVHLTGEASGRTKPDTVDNMDHLAQVACLKAGTCRNKTMDTERKMEDK